MDRLPQADVCFSGYSHQIWWYVVFSAALALITSVPGSWKSHFIRQGVILSGGLHKLPAHDWTDGYPPGSSTPRHTSAGWPP